MIGRASCPRRRATATVLSRSSLTHGDGWGGGPSPPDRRFCGCGRSRRAVALVAPLSAGELPRHSVSRRGGSCPARRFVGVSLTRETTGCGRRRWSLPARRRPRRRSGEDPVDRRVEPHRPLGAHEHGEREGRRFRRPRRPRPARPGRGRRRSRDRSRTRSAPPAGGPGRVGGDDQGAGAPAFTVATANAPAPTRARSPLHRGCVAASAMMSGPAAPDAESRSVLMPEITGAGSVVPQSNERRPRSTRTRRWGSGRTRTFPGRPRGSCSGVLGGPSAGWCLDRWSGR